MAINPTNHTVYQLNGITAFSNDPAVNTRSVESGHLVIDASASANMLTIEGVTYAYNKQSVNNVLDTQFNYFKFPVQVVYSPIDSNIDIDIPVPEETDKPDPIFARYKPNESINLMEENWNPIELSDIEDGNAQKRPNRYYINKAIKDENKPLRFRFNWNITVENITGNDTIIAAIMLLQESPNKTLWEKGYSPGWTTGYEWPNLPPDTVNGIKNWGDYVDATLTLGVNTGLLDITVPPWDYDIGDKFSVVIVYYKEQWDTKWHWFGRHGGEFKNYWDEPYNNWYRKVKNGRYVATDESDYNFTPSVLSKIRDMKTLVPYYESVRVLNTYVEPTKKALFEQMTDSQFGNTPGYLEVAGAKATMVNYETSFKFKGVDDWTFSSHGDEAQRQQFYTYWIQHGFRSKDGPPNLPPNFDSTSRPEKKGLDGIIYVGGLWGNGTSNWLEWIDARLLVWKNELPPEEFYFLRTALWTNYLYGATLIYQTKYIDQGHIGTIQGMKDYDEAKLVFDSKIPKIIINEDKTWLSVTNAEKQVDVWNRKLTP